MSIEKMYDKYYAECNVCGEALAPESSFDKAIAAKNYAGWKSYRIGNSRKWKDICYECQMLEER